MTTNGDQEIEENNFVFNVLDWHEFDEIPYEDENNSDSDNNSPDSNKKKYVKESDKKYVIKMFGRTELGESVYIRVDGFPPHFYILLPDNWKNDLQTKCDYLMDVIKRKNSNLEDTLEKYEIVYRKKFYGFCAGKKWPFMRLVFKNKKAMSDAARMFDNKICMFTSSNNRANIKEKFIKFDVYESTIDPYLRFMHIQDLQSCGWIKINKSKLIESFEPTTCTYAYNVDWFDVLPMNEKIGIAPFIIASFDLECKSWDGINFPVASDIRNPIIQIGISLSKYGSQDVYKRIMISLNTCDPIEGAEVYVCKREKELLEKFQEIMQKEDPDIYTGYNILNFDIPYLFERANHKDIKVNEKFFHLSKLKDRRCKMITKNLSSSALGDNKLNYIDAIGRIPIDLMKVVQRDFKLSSYKLDSVAENFFRDKVTKIDPFLTAEQIINNKMIDENIAINEDTDYGEFAKNLQKQTSYKVYSKNISILTKGNYVRFEKDGEVYMAKYKIIDINHRDGWFVLDSINSILLTKGKIFWGMVKDDIKPKDIFELYEKTSADRKLVAEYCIQDCVLVSKLMAKIEVLTNNISMASVCHVPLHFIFFRGQGIKSLSLVAKTCRKEGYLIPVMKKDSSEEVIDGVGYEGATVFDPEIGFHRKPIAVKDYNSLYPSSIISKNVSHETLVTSPEYDNLPGYIYYDVSYNNQDGSKTHCRYAKKVDEYLETNPSKSKFGIIPAILAFLLAERKAKKKEMNRETDPFKKTILDGTQNALKVTANSIYGQLGAPTSPIYFKHGAACTTSIGRTMLETGRDFVEKDLTGILMGLYNCIKTNNDVEWENILANKLKERDPNFELKLREFLIDCFDKYTMKPRIVYGDTDSIFINFDLKDKITSVDVYDKITLYYCIELGKISSKFLKTLLPYPHNMEYEKTFYPFAQMAKKKYVGNKYEDDVDSFKFSCMGVVLKRRDNAHIVKKIVGSMVDIMMNEIDIDKTIRTTKKLINDLLKGNFEIHEFITSKTLKGTYKGTKMTTDSIGKAGDSGVWPWDDVNCQQAHILLAQRMAKRDPGNAPQLNDRIPFVAIETPTKKGVKMLQGERIEHPEYILEKELRVDYLFYLTNQIMNPAKQFLDLIMKPSEVEELFRNFINREEDRRKGRQSLSKFGISKNGTNSNDTDINIDMFINKQAKPSNAVASKKSELIKSFKEINNSGSKSTFVRLPKEEYLTVDTNIDSDDDNNELISGEKSDTESDEEDANIKVNIHNQVAVDV
jgi:DNA polymerase elongation subunit (family B)